MILSKEAMKEELLSREENRKTDVFTAVCENTAFLLDHCEITVPEENTFFVSVDVSEIQIRLSERRSWKYGNEILAQGSYRDGVSACAYTGVYDFGHTSAEWKSVLSLGIVGLRDRIAAYAEENKGDAEKTRFYNGLLLAYNASLRFLTRGAEEARIAGKEKMAEGLAALTKRAPQTLFEAMQTILAYYALQQYFDGTALRTLGRLDSLLYPFARMENDETVEYLLAAFLLELDRIKATANIPFALGGTDADGNSLVNPLSYAILRVYRKLNTAWVKFHLLCADNTPEDLIKETLDAVREGKNSVVFLSDGKIIESLEKMGEDRADAADYHVVGCYECGGNGELTCSCNARVNLPKALELTLFEGKDLLSGKEIGLVEQSDFPDYNALYAAVMRQLAYLCGCAMDMTNRYESHYDEIHAAPILSGTYLSALEKGKDLYGGHGAKYNNSSLNALGLATLTDSLYVIKTLVYEEKVLSLAELKAVLRNNWEGKESLRLRVKNKLAKYGMGKKAVDGIAKDVVDALASFVSGKANGRGGVWRLGLFSIDWRWAFGEHTAASADGRLAGEPLSQNTSASFGADREGVTAHLASVATPDASLTPNGAIADIDLHSSAVTGDDGLCAMVATLKTYFKMGGFGVHYNVLDRKTLEEAKRNPEKYPNLQVRLCGWNVKFSQLSQRAQDEFIARSKE